MFVLTPATAYANGSGTVDASALNYWKAAIANALDGAGGGTYALSSQLVLTGSGLKLSGGTALELDATSACIQDAGGVFTWSGTQHIANGALLDVQNGGQFSIVAGGSETVFGQIIIESTGQLNIASSGNATVLSGGTFTVNSGGASHIAGTESIQSGGILDILNGGIAKVESGGEINVKSGGEILVDTGGHIYTAMPASNAGPAANDILSLGVAKAWAQITTHSGAAVVDDGYNVSNSFSYPVFLAQNAIKVSWATPFASGNYGVTVQGYADSAGPDYVAGFVVSKTANDCTIVFLGTSNGTSWSLYNPNSSSFTFYIEANGRQ